jgi:hypothetical protein
MAAPSAHFRILRLSELPNTERKNQTKEAKMKKVRIHKHCKINGKPVQPGEIQEVDEARAKALTDNKYADVVQSTTADASSSQTASPTSTDSSTSSSTSVDETATQPAEEEPAADDTQDDIEAI